MFWKKFIIVGIVLFVITFLTYRFFGKKCYLELSENVIIIEIGVPKNTSLIDGYYSNISILTAQNKYSLFPKLLLTAKIGGGLVENENCDCFEINKNQILILKKFYSNNSGKSFIDLNKFTELIQKTFDEKNLKVCYPYIEDNKLFLAYNTFDNYNVTKIFTSNNGGKTWTRIEFN